MFIKIGYDIELEISAPMTLIHLLRVHPSRERDLQAPEAFEINPPLACEDYLDHFGNRCGRINVPAGVSTVRFRNEAIVSDSGRPDAIDLDATQHDPCDLPVNTLQFLLASRYCEVDSELMQFAWSRFSHVPRGWRRVQAICDVVHDHIRFDYQQARATRTAREGFAEKVGVCRDYAHLAITLCRCLNIPARYCNGYLGDIGVPANPAPMDFNAWFEVYLDGRWLKLDATIPAEVAKAKGKPYVRDYDGVHDIPTVEGPIIKENGSFADYPEDVARWYEQMAKETMAALDSSSSKARTAGDDAFWTGPQAEALKKG